MPKFFRSFPLHAGPVRRIDIFIDIYMNELQRELQYR